MARIAIVTAFGRAHHLAKLCSTLNLDVVVIDVSQQFSWPKNYWMGPMPLQWPSELETPDFRSPKIDVPQGLSILTGKGVFEFGGQLIEHRLAAEGLSTEILKASAFRLKDFQTEFPAALFLKALSPLEIEPSRPSPYSREIDLKKPIFLGDPDLKLEALESIKVETKTKIEDVAFSQSSKLSGLLLKNERSEILDVDQLVWALTSQETLFINEKLSEKIFAGQTRKSAMSWICFEAKIDHFEAVPDYLMWVEDPELPWSDEYLVIFQRQKRTSRFLIWIKILSEQRFQSSLLDERKKAIKESIERKWPKAKVTDIQDPLEKNSTAKSLGPALFASYLEGIWSKTIEPSFKNIHFLNPERFEIYGLNEWILQEQQVFQKLETWWKNELAIQAKKELKEKRP